MARSSGHVFDPISLHLRPVQSALYEKHFLLPCAAILDPKFYEKHDARRSVMERGARLVVAYQCEVFYLLIDFRQEFTRVKGRKLVVLVVSLLLASLALESAFVQL